MNQVSRKMETLGILLVRIADQQERGAERVVSEAPRLVFFV